MTHIQLQSWKQNPFHLCPIHTSHTKDSTHFYFFIFYVLYNSAKLGLTKIKTIQSVAHAPDTPVLLKHDEGHQLWFESID